MWFSPGTPVSPTNKIDHHNIVEILLKVVLNTITQRPTKNLDLQTFLIFLLQNYIFFILLSVCFYTV
jgi:hypothetical protein